jgi:hypothetical protein
MPLPWNGSPKPETWRSNVRAGKFTPLVGNYVTFHTVQQVRSNVHLDAVSGDVGDVQNLVTAVGTHAVKHARLPSD